MLNHSDEHHSPLDATRRSAIQTLGNVGLATFLFPRGLAAQTPIEPRPPQDLWPAFWSIYDLSASRKLRERAGLLMANYFQPRIKTFLAAEMKHVTVDTVSQWLISFDPIAQNVRRLHQRFASDYSKYAAHFKAFLPDFDGRRSPVTLLPSLLNFDAHLAPNGPDLPLYFGLDGIVAFHGPSPDLAVLFSHETFHCYQGQKNPGVMLQDKLPVYAGLWIEGGATWISERLNPQASAVSILLDDRGLAAIAPDALRRALQAISTRFDSMSDEDASAFFTIGYKGDWPARTGYLVGLQIARRVAPAMSVSSFAALPLAAMRPLYRTALDDLMENH